MLNREVIFGMIDQERGFQDTMYNGVIPGGKPTFDELNTIGHWVQYIESYLERAKSKFFRRGLPEGMIPKEMYMTNPQKCHDIHTREILKDLVKVAALCVATLEYLGGTNIFKD